MTGKFDLLYEGIEPAVSPDGVNLVFISGGDLVLLRHNSRTTLATGQISTPAFFPDNQRIAYVEGFPGRRIIRTIEAPLTDSGDCFQPSVSPDGQSLAFACSDTRGSQIWIMNLAFRNRHPITTGACNHTWPAWARDSRAVIFASDCNRGFALPALYTLRVDTIKPAR